MKIRTILTFLGSALVAASSIFAADHGDDGDVVIGPEYNDPPSQSSEKCPPFRGSDCAELERRPHRKGV